MPFAAAGSLLAGLGYAGAGLPTPPSAAPVMGGQRALFLDPSTGEFDVQADGTLTSLHPVDSEMASITAVERSALPAFVTFGNTFRQRLAAATPSQRQAAALQAAKESYAAPLGRRDILLLNVTYLTGGYVDVRYRNLRTNPLPPSP